MSDKTEVKRATDILQIIPAVGWHARYENGGGGDGEGPWVGMILGWALCRDGFVRALEVGDDGIVDTQEPQSDRIVFHELDKRARGWTGRVVK